MIAKLLFVLILQFNLPAIHDTLMARIIANEAAVHHERGEWIDAANEFDEAFRLYQDPTLLYNEAISWAKAGLYPSAYASLARFLTYDIPPNERDLAKTHQAVLLQKMNHSPHRHVLVWWNHAAHDRKFPHGHKHF